MPFSSPERKPRQLVVARMSILTDATYPNRVSKSRAGLFVPPQSPDDMP
jgi:hypothetical protein